MAARLAWVRRQDGFWNVNFGDPNNCPGPETSGTAFFIHGLAWGQQPSDHQPVRTGDTSNFAVGPPCSPPRTSPSWEVARP
ncbi:hypothetical protein GCM10011609_53580 [Lentzea pudingi]|uniref:Uncharacterized protein n=1 Tax=Lentzea pudingi TaxID=1789439 RepID=A0ABQ2IGF5_9PSEU|nr:hypothetical protein GCM10011609_53580 [Lentzea pudingi]